MSKNLLVWEVKPYGLVIAWKIIKIKVATFDHGNGVRSPNTVNGNTALVSGIGSQGSNGIMFTKDQVTETQLVEKICNSWVKDIVVDIATNNDKVTKCLTLSNGFSQIFKEGHDEVTIVIVVLKIFGVLSEDTQLSCSIAVGAVYRKQTKMGVIKTAIAHPAPLT